MAKGRMLLRRISKSEKLNMLSCDTARLLYTWMLAHLDCNGCYHANPVIVKNEVFCIREDVTKQKIASYLNEMENLLLIKRYCDNQYLFYPDFEEKQPKIQKDREGKSEIPEPSDELRKTTHELLMTYSGVTHTQSKIKEGKVKEDKTKHEPHPSDAEYDKRFLEFWDHYGNKIDKDKCNRWYKKEVTSDQLHKSIMDGITKWKSSDKWMRGYQENPYTFLYNRRWDADIKQPLSYDAIKQKELEDKFAREGKI